MKERTSKRQDESLPLGLSPTSTAWKSEVTEDKTIKLMTYNLKYASPNFEPSWEVRREMQVDIIRQYRPDIMGTQEGLKEQIDYLMDHLPEYVVVGEGKRR